MIPLKNNLCLHKKKLERYTSKLSLGGEIMGDLIFSHLYNSSIMNVYYLTF